ncbi:MAG: hypothetical protein ACE3JQ_00215 [Paenisporosarcina sp.]
MVNIGRKLYYDLLTGDILVNTGERTQSTLITTTIEEDIFTYRELSERNRETFDVIELPYGAYAGDFTIATGYRVNPATKELEFSYPDPNAPKEPQVFQQPLSEEVAKLKEEDLNNKEAIAELYMMSMGGF